MPHLAYVLDWPARHPGLIAANRAPWRVARAIQLKLLGQALVGIRPAAWKEETDERSQLWRPAKRS